MSGGAVQYDNYRSSSWDSATYQKESEALLDPLMSNSKAGYESKNPYEQYAKAQKSMKKKKGLMSGGILGGDLFGQKTNHHTVVEGVSSNPYNTEQLIQVEGFGDHDKRKTYKFSFKVSKEQQR